MRRTILATVLATLLVSIPAMAGSAGDGWAGRWEGVIALALPGDPVGSPGDIIMTVTQGDAPRVAIIAGSVFTGDLKAISLEPRKLRGGLPGAMHDPEANMYLVRNGDWAWGIFAFPSLKDTANMVARVYLKRRPGAP